MRVHKPRFLAKMHQLRDCGPKVYHGEQVSPEKAEELRVLHIAMNTSAKGGVIALRFGKEKHPSSAGSHKMIKVQFTTGYIRVLHAATASNQEPAFLWLEFYDKD